MCMKVTIELPDTGPMRVTVTDTVQRRTKTMLVNEHNDGAPKIDHMDRWSNVFRSITDHIVAHRHTGKMIARGTRTRDQFHAWP
jgi:hypothetical protein